MAPSLPVSLLLLLVAAVDAAAEVEPAAPAEAGALPADVAVAVMLLATMTFIMSTFYLTKSEDEDIRKASWQVLSTTISIFSAVLLFQGVNGTLEFYYLTSLEGADRDWAEIQLSFGHAFVWYMLMQLALAWLTGAVTLAELTGQMKHESDSESDAEAERNVMSRPTNIVELHAKQEAELNLKSWAVLLGHITGFACINCFGTLQQRFVNEDVAGDTPADATRLIYATAACLVSWMVLQVLFSVAYKFRLIVSRSDDGELDEMEIMWDEETEETEDDVLGLCVSFTIVQVLRYGITSRLPNEEGEVPPGSLVYSFGQAFSLMGAGLFIFGCHVFRMLFVHSGSKFKRVKEQFKTVASMVFAWCFFFGMQWHVQIIVRLAGGSPTGNGMDTIRAVCLALFLTIACYIMIFVLDRLADADWTGSEADATITDLIKGLGILIGFAWEKSFDAAVTVSAEKMAYAYVPQCAVKLGLSVIICTLVVPAWRWYILPELQQLGAFEEFAEDRDIEEELMEGGQISDVEEVRRMTARLTRHDSRLQKKGSALFDDEFALAAKKRNDERRVKLECIAKETIKEDREFTPRAGRSSVSNASPSPKAGGDLSTPLLAESGSAVYSDEECAEQERKIAALRRDIQQQREELTKIPMQIKETLDALGRSHDVLGALSPRHAIRRVSA